MKLMENNYYAIVARIPLLLHCSLAGIRGHTEKSVEHEHTFLATCQNKIRNQDVLMYIIITLMLGENSRHFCSFHVNHKNMHILDLMVESDQNLPTALHFGGGIPRCIHLNNLQLMT